MCEEKVEGNSGCFFLFWLWFSLHQCDWGIKKDEKQCGSFWYFCFQTRSFNQSCFEKGRKDGENVAGFD